MKVLFVSIIVCILKYSKNDIKLNKRFPNIKHHYNDYNEYYYDLYEDFDSKPTPWYKKLLNAMSRCLYFMTGPKFLVPIIGDCLKSQFKNQLHVVYLPSKNIRVCYR